MTDEDLAAIEQRVQAATPGPWGVAFAEEEIWIETDFDDEIATMSARADGDATLQRSDAEFIAHAREDVPALLAEVRRLRALLDTTRGALADIGNMTGHEQDNGVQARKARRVYADTAP